jgi:hypothetical protein
MRASSRKLALALAERLGEILPPPLVVRALGDCLEVQADGTGWGGSAAAAIVEEEDGRSLAERVETAVRAILSGVQDAAAEYLTLPWPLDAAGAMALPDARTDAERVFAWFGDCEADAAVTLRPIALAELAGERSPEGVAVEE